MKDKTKSAPRPGILPGLLLAASIGFTGCSSPGTPAGYPDELVLDEAVLLDKIKGGWAGQVIGCTYGGPTEFRYNGTLIQDYITIPWDEDRMAWYYDHAPGLYDDIYMDLTFVDIFEKEGLDAPARSHARAFARADYLLWHANQAARYNILLGMDPPESGHWRNNPHADDIDFQIEADFAGLMSPGLVRSSTEVCDRVGHIMNYGDGWYGGVYVAALYSLSFLSDDIPFVVEEALKTIHHQSQFHQCISDVIGWWKENPDDWKQTWFEVERKWSSDIGCPDGVFRPFDIDAKINAAYIVIGLLYGGGDFGKTLDISTRCGQDSDCNPASAGGVLGCMLGYEAIPSSWKAGLDKVEDRDFKYTTLSLTDTYDMSFRHALDMVRRAGGRVEEGRVHIPVQTPEETGFERSFPGHFPTALSREGATQLRSGSATEQVFTFDGIGFVWRGEARKEAEALPDTVLEVEVMVDGALHETALLPTRFQTRRHEITWNYAMDPGMHEVALRWTRPIEGYVLDLGEVLVYGPDETNPTE
ncbi:MAG: ADP-ribosylglycohydrolase family protein [Bacteroidales bacterium]